MKQEWVIVIIVGVMAIIIGIGIRIVHVTGKHIFGENILRVPLPRVKLFSLRKKKEQPDGNVV